MVTIELVHPRLGICGSQTFKNIERKQYFINNWIHKYGQKFYECDVKITQFGIKEKKEKKEPKPKREILHIPTGNVYNMVTEAAFYTGESESTIHGHLYERYSSRFKYRFKFQTIKNENQ